MLPITLLQVAMMINTVVGLAIIWRIEDIQGWGRPFALFY